MAEEFKQHGYDKEAEYFYKKNQELIQRRRAQLDQERARQATNKDQAFFLKCPKCGGAMTELNLAGIMVDQCQRCQGVYFDKGELELLVATEDPGLIRGAIKGMLRLP